MQPSAPPEAMVIHVSIGFSVSDRIEVGSQAGDAYGSRP